MEQDISAGRPHNRFTTLLATMLRAFYLFSPGIFFLVIYYLIIVWMPIGQDMLMHAGEETGPMAWTVISLLLWMLFAWFSSRLIADLYEATNHPSYRGFFVSIQRSTPMPIQ